MEALNKTELVPNTVTVRDRQTLNIPGIQTDRQTDRRNTDLCSGRAESRQ